MFREFLYYELTQRRADLLTMLSKHEKDEERESGREYTQTVMDKAEKNINEIKRLLKEEAPTAEEDKSCIAALIVLKKRLG